MQHLLIDEIPSPLGRIVIAARGERLCALEFGRARVIRSLAVRFAGVPLMRSPDPFGFSRKIRAYLAGDLSAVDDIPVEARGTALQRRIWRALRGIPAGSTMSYGAMARALGLGGAARAVGAANGRNPVSIVIPCHRLIGADASLTGYGGGLWRKRWLLCHEGAIGAPPEAVSSKSGSERPRGRDRSPRRTRAARHSGSRR